MEHHSIFVDNINLLSRNHGSTCDAMGAVVGSFHCVNLKLHAASVRPGGGETIGPVVGDGRHSSRCTDKRRIRIEQTIKHLPSLSRANGQVIEIYIGCCNFIFKLRQD